jgi:NAD(P)-dependent dehydrogenase (short-subunit alcohol dehydrogenase family)
MTAPFTRLDGRDGGDPDPSRWREHRFGLPADRWQALAGQAFWIIGAGSGYGRSLAVALAAAGAHVFLGGRTREKLEGTLAACRELDIDTGACHSIPVDITDEASLQEAAAAIGRLGVTLTGWVHCAAMPLLPAGPTPLADLPSSTWRQLFDTNVTGAWLAWKAACPLLASSQLWRGLLFSSAAGWSATPGYGPYNITKAALNNLGMSLAAEAARAHSGRDIQINVIDPGEARTEMNQGSTRSPYAVVAMSLALLSHPAGGPNGRFFHRNGRHLAFANAAPFPSDLLTPT